MPDEQQEYDMRQLRQDVAYIAKTIQDHDVILQGRRDSPKPEGIIYTVSENTKFRKYSSKVLWLLFVIVLGLVTSQAFDFIETLISFQP